MTEIRSLPPAAEVCLDRPHASSQKGGTLIAEDVRDLAVHERYLKSPDAYRPAACPRCRSALHIHDLRPRVLLADPAVTTEVIRFRCADREGCGAAWQILPAFLARHLWRSWAVVEQSMQCPAPSEVPARTRRRWRARLACAARVLVAVMATATNTLYCAVAMAVGLGTDRHGLVRSYAAHARPAPNLCLAELAAAVHRLSPGVRLM
jgi:hypothetical protein